MKNLGGTYFNNETPDQLMRVLETLRRTKTRICINYGDTKTGTSWNEKFDTKGIISRSSGIQKIPILLYNARSLSGGAILTHHILSIKETVKPYNTLYTHEN